MKNQYVGDINDYRKYGLLRSLQTVSDMRLLVSWMLTKDDGSSDGKFIDYLKNPKKWEKYDPSHIGSCTVSLMRVKDDMLA